MNFTLTISQIQKRYRKLEAIFDGLSEEEKLIYNI